MKYTIKNKLKKSYNFNKLYTFSELHKTKFIEKVPKRNNHLYKQVFFNNDYKYEHKDININSVDNFSNEKLLKEIQVLKEKLNKYKNELIIIKRENNVQNKYMKLLEQKYILQLISNKENLNYKNIKNELIQSKEKIYKQNKNENNHNYKTGKKEKNEKKKNFSTDNFNYKEFKQKIFNKK